MLQGQIDHCRGRYIFGWAIPAGDRAHCRITVIDAAATDAMGQVLADTLADDKREDLVAVGGGRIDFAFCVGVPVTAGDGPVRVFADEVELPGSPLYLEASIFDGAFAIQNGIVSGWVSNRHAVSATPDVALFDQDGRLIATLPTMLQDAEDDDLFRPALFSAPLPAESFGRSELYVAAQIAGTCFASAWGCARLEGYLDSVSESRCVGWIFSPDAPDRSFRIEVWRGGVLAGSGATSRHRGDVSAHYPAAGNCGFDFALVEPRSAEHETAEISIRLEGSDHDLFGGPFLLRHKPQAIQQLYDTAAAIHRSDFLSPQDAGLLREVIAEWLREARSSAQDMRIRTRRTTGIDTVTSRRIAVVVPVYSDVAGTRICLESVLRDRTPGRDSLVLVNDNPADAEIGALLDSISHHPDVFILRNETNRGFIGAVNRALAFVRAGDVLLLNADTEMFPGTLDEMHAVLHSDADIGSVTAISNNATLFSYPHPDLVTQTLDDISWAELAAVARQLNAGTSVDIPTGHGFCMLLRRTAVDEVGLLDTAFGRGYGEENDYSLRAADRGWRHVAAGGALVRHVEAVSFGEGKAELVAANLQILAGRFPDYADRVDRFAAADPVRRLRWALDLHRLRRLRTEDARLELVIENGLDGGTQYAASDIDAVVRTPEMRTLRLTATISGALHLRAEGLTLLSVFQPEDIAELFRMLTDLAPERVVVHHLLGFDESFVRALGEFMAGRRTLFHLHDFYYACPRVTLIDASGAFCGGAATDRCERCIAMGGTHEADRMAPMTVAAHRALFQSVLAQATHLIAPSEDAASRLATLLPDLRPTAVPHPQTDTTFPICARRGSFSDICLLGGIGPHKGSATLLALARQAWLNRPELRFHVVGHTDIDTVLEAIGNVSISGRYDRADLPNLVEATGARIALFLHGWPETFSYTVTEAVALGLIPIVPDLGAPAERVRAAGFGVVFPYPIEIEPVLRVLSGLAAGSVPFSRDGGLPLGFETADSRARLLGLYNDAPLPAVRRAVRRRASAG